MTDLRVGQRVRHRMTGREGVYRGESGYRRATVRNALVLWDGQKFVLAYPRADLIPVEPVPGEGERGAG